MKKLFAAVTLFLAYLFSPTAFAQITGPTSFCMGHNGTLNGLPAGGTWTSSNPAVATISATGVVSPVAAGTTSISYSTWPTSVVITVNASPAAIAGGGVVTCGSTTTLTDATPGGTWSSSNPAAATISAGGVVSPVTYSSTTISYTLPTGCSAAQTVAVLPVLSPFPVISGPSSVCVGGTISLSVTPPGSGTWSSTSGLVSVSSAGVVTGLTPGAETVNFNLVTACGVIPLNHNVSVTPVATAGTIFGSTALVCGTPSTLISSAGAGTWVSSNPAVATVGATSGILAPVTAGSATITFTYTSSCGTATTTTPVTVSPVSAGSVYGTSIICGGTTTFTSTMPGGTWSSSAPAVATINASTGVATGVSAGSATITYTMASSCGVTTTTAVLAVGAGFAGTISGPSALCVGTTGSLSSSISGGTWSSSTPGFVTVSTSGGLLTAVSPGTSTITYSIPTVCGYATTTTVITAVPLPTTGLITGTTMLVCGSLTSATGLLTSTIPGGTWSSSTPAVVTVSPTSGGLTSVSAGTSTITYTVSSACGTASTTTVVHVSTQPITVFVTPMWCDTNTWGLALDADTYVWAPATGLSCTACATPAINTTVTTVYTVTGTSSCGTVTTSVLMDANRIRGHITFAGPVPAYSGSEVWLIRYNPADSSIIDIDSTMTCYDTVTWSRYYKFEGKPAGDYLVKAKLSGSGYPIGYIPTYGGSTPHWFNGAHIHHTATTTNVQDIDMMYASYPPGPCLIEGYIYAGADTTTGVYRMLVYLKNAMDQVVAFTYTDGSGFYQFGGLPAGSYIVYPEYYDYYTTAPSMITLSMDALNARNINFGQFDTSRTIFPLVTTGDGGVGIVNADAHDAIVIHPNPAHSVVNISWMNQAVGSGTVVIRDMVGREVYRTGLDINAVSGEQAINLDKLSAGAYIINVRSEGINYTGKLVLNK